MPASLKEPRFKARFSAAAHLYTPTETQRGEVRASIDRLRALLPAEIDPADHPTMLYVVGNLFIGGLVNKNDDAVTIEDTLAIYHQFEGQQINIEHQRGNLVGYIVKAGLSELGTDKLITEEEARKANQPFNVAIVIGLWKVVDPELVEFILSAAQEGSPNKDALSLSFEVGFDSYSIVLLPAGASNLALANKIVPPDAPDFAKWDTLLRVNHGAGLVGRSKERVARVLKDGILPLGGGIVTNPAAQVKGITPVNPDDFTITEIAPDVDDAATVTASMYEYSSTQVTLSQADAQPFLSYASTIPDEHLYHGEPGGPAKYGRETESHVTALYGIVGADTTPIQALVAGAGPLRVKFGKVSAFSDPAKPYDVLHVEVESDDLERLQALLAASVEHKNQYL